MTSVWKRIQRVGKRASKFQFIASYQTLTLECSRDGKWQPNKLNVIWSRRSKRKAIKGETWQPSIANPYRGMIVWTDPEEIEITVTLYKDARDGSPFEDKLWTFVVEDEAVSGKRRPVASVSVNMVDYHSIDLQTFCLNLPLRPATKKVVSASLELNLGCVLLKEGNAMDEDMISMSSLMSLNDPYGSRDFEDSGKNFKRNTNKRLSLRSGKSKNKPTFNMASPTNTGSPKPKKPAKNRGKTATSELLNSSFPAEKSANSLNKPLSTSDTDLSKIGNRSSPVLPKKHESKSAAEEELLKWCQECVKDYKDVTVTNMTTSWRNGLAFCAVVHHFYPEMIDFSKLKPDEIRENNRLAFEAFDYLGISRILDPHQMVLASVPDKLLIMTYLHQIKQHFTTKPAIPDDEDQLNELTLVAISEVGKKLTQISENTIADFTRKHTTESIDFGQQNKKKNEFEMDSSKANKLQYEAKPGYNPFEDEPEKTLKTEEVKGNLGDVLESDVIGVRTTEVSTIEEAATESNSAVDDVVMKDVSIAKVVTESNTAVDEVVTKNDEVCESETKKETEKPSDLDLSATKSVKKPVVYSPKPGYNPFLDDDGSTVKEKTSSKEPLNPFDDDYEEKLLQQSAELNRTSSQLNEPSSKSAHSREPIKQAEKETAPVSKQRSLNPFDDDYEESPEPTIVENKTVRQTEDPKPVSTGVLRTGISSSGMSGSPRMGNNSGAKRMRKAPEPPTSIPNKSAAVTKPLTRTLATPEPIDIVIRNGSLPGSPRGSNQPSPGPISPKKVIPSFKEWKAQKSDDVAKQEQRKAQARQMIKEARAKSAKSPVSPRNETNHIPNNTTSIQHETNLSPTNSLPKLVTPSKKYRAPEPPSQVKSGNLASRLKDEIEFQKRITEKTRRTLESSRIKRINPKQEKLPVSEVRSERSEKVQQAINDAKENPNRRFKPIDVPKSDVQNEQETIVSSDSSVISPPKPPRAYTYTETNDTTSSEDQGGEKDSSDVEDQTGSGVDNTATGKSGEEETTSSLQQNPFKLTIKKKESIPQAVVKPIPVTKAGRETKINLKKYSVRSSKLNTARVDELCDGRKKHRKGNYTEATEKVKYPGHLSNSQDSLSDGQQSSEEDVNDILDNIAVSSENETKTDEESFHYDNAEEEEDFQDTSQYVEHEIATLEEDRIALDRVAVKLEKELRDAMNTADSKEEEQRLFQEWFLLVNKRNEIVRRQTELSILEKEEDLEKRFELLNRELRFLMSDNNREKTSQEQKREELLLSELVLLVNKRDELVRIEDSQIQEAEKNAKHVEHVVQNTRIPKKQSECSIQ